MMQPIFIFGASGHAKVVCDLVEKEDRRQIAFLVDDNRDLAGKNFFGYPVAGGRDALLNNPDRPSRALVAIGDNYLRATVAGWLASHGVDLISALHPSVQIGRGVSIGDGTVLMANAVLNPDTVIGKNVIVNTGARVDHDCMISDNVHIAPGATLCGGVRVGENTLVGAGATVAPNVSVGDNVVIGAGATVVRDLPDDVLAVGVPAKPKY